MASQDPNIVVEDESPKKSTVMMKMKAKARKIKDSINKHTHGNHPVEEDTVEEPDTPVYDTSATSGPVPGQVENLGHSRVNHGRPTEMEASKVKPESPLTDREVDDLLARNAKPESHVGSQDESKDQERAKLGLTSESGGFPQEVPHNTPISSTVTADTDHNKEHIEPESKFEKDYVAPKHTPDAHTPSSYQKDEKESGIERSFDEMKIQDDDKSKPKSGKQHNFPSGTEEEEPFTQSHDKFSGKDHGFPSGTGEKEPFTQSHDQFSGKDHGFPPETEEKEPFTQSHDHFSGKEQSFPSETEEEERFTQSHDHFSGKEQSFPSETEEEELLTSVPSNRHDQSSPELPPPKVQTTAQDRPHEDAGNVSYIASAKNGVASMFGYGKKENVEEEHHEIQAKETDVEPTGSQDEFSSERALPPSNIHTTNDYPHDDTNPSGYTGTVLGAAAAAKNAVASKLGHGEKDGEHRDRNVELEIEDKTISPRNVEKDNMEEDEMHGGAEGKNKAELVKEYIEDHSKPEEDDKPLADVMRESLHQPKAETEDHEGKNKAELVKEYIEEQSKPEEDDKPLADVMTESLHQPKVETEKGTETTNAERKKEASPRPVTEVISDASHTRYDDPDEEVTRNAETRKEASPRPVTEVISDASQTRNDNPDEEVTRNAETKKEASPRPVTEVIADAFHKRNDDPDEEVTRPMGKVTESLEVKNRLDPTVSDSSEEKPDAAVATSPGMVGRIRGAVGSWFTTPTPESPQPLDPTTGSPVKEAGHKSSISEE